MKDKSPKAVDDQSIGIGPQSYTFTERVLTGDTKGTFHQAALDLGIRAVDNFNKVITEMKKDIFPAYALREQKKYLHRHLITHRIMKLCTLLAGFKNWMPT